jgi:hypothetical protein
MMGTMRTWAIGQAKDVAMLGCGLLVFVLLGPWAVTKLLAWVLDAAIRRVTGWARRLRGEVIEEYQPPHLLKPRRFVSVGLTETPGEYELWTNIPADATPIETFHSRAAVAGRLMALLPLVTPGMVVAANDARKPLGMVPPEPAGGA